MKTKDQCLALLNTMHAALDSRATHLDATAYECMISQPAKSREAKEVRDQADTLRTIIHDYACHVPTHIIPPSDGYEDEYEYWCDCER